MKSPDDESSEDWLPGRGTSLYFGALAVHVAVGITVSSLDADLREAMRSARHGESTDLVFQWMGISYFGTLLLMFGVGFALGYVYSQRSAVIRYGPWLAWALPTLWFIAWLAIFRPHS